MTRPARQTLPATQTIKPAECFVGVPPAASSAFSSREISLPRARRKLTQLLRISRFHHPSVMAKSNSILLVASGDLRQSANEVCWPAQHAMEKALTTAVAKLGYKLVRAHPYKSALKHGFIGSQKEGMEVFARLDPTSPLIVAEAVWQYSHHVLAGLISHRGPILTVANWSGTWPGLVGMLNLNGSLTKAGVNYSTLWSADFTDEYFITGLKSWLTTGVAKHKT